jgi:hypothetical protein
MWYKMSWGLGVLTVVLLIGFSMLIIPAQMELKQIREEAKATQIRMQEQKDHVHADNGTRVGHLEQDTETTVEPNNPVNINESGNMTETTETAAVGTGANGEVFRYKDGIYKGMTYPEAVKFWQKRVNGAKKEYRNVHDIYYNMEEALMNASHSGMAILVTGLRKLPSDVYERAMDQVFKNDPNGREKFEAYMNEVEKYSYSNLESIADQVSMFKNESEYRQMLRVSLDELRPERDRLNAEFRKIFKEPPPRRIRRN